MRKQHALLRGLRSGCSYTSGRQKKGLANEKDAGGHEAYIHDNAAGFDCNEIWDAGVNDCYMNAFGRLLEETHPGHGTNDYPEDDDMYPWEERSIEGRNVDPDATGGNC